MAGFTLTAASSILKTQFIGPIRKVLNNATILMNRIAKTSAYQNVTGKSFTVPLHTGRNVNAGSGRAESGTLPSADNQTYGEAVVPNKFIYARIQLTGPVIAATKNNAGAFVDAVKSEVDGAVNDIKYAMNRQMHSDGTDALAFWTGADDTSGVTVDDGQGNAFVHLPTGKTITCDLIDASDNSTVLGDDIVVTLGAKAAANYAITFTGSVSGSADSDYLVLKDTLVTGVGYQMMGIRGIISTANPPLLSGGLHGLAVASATYWKAQESANAGTLRPLTFELLQQPIDDIVSNSDAEESDIEFLLCSYGIRRKYYTLCAQERRMVNTMTLDGGFKALDFDGFPLVADQACRRNTVYYIVPSSLKIFRTSDFSWMEKDGSMFSRVANTDAYEATLFHYGDLACLNRNQNGILLDVTE